MQIRLIAFSRKGCSLAKKIADLMQHECHVYGKTLFAEDITQISSLHKWTEESFKEYDAIIFIGAAGIAVRAISPFIVNKTKDPAVIVIDENGTFIIPILSGHIGGANKLAEEIASQLGSQAVITTATDINGKFSVDSFAEERGMHISSMMLAKDVSAYILERGKMAFSSDFPIEGKLPDSLYLSERDDIGILVSAAENKNIFDKTLQLIPKTIVLGIGCRKGTPLERIDEEVLKALKSSNVSMHAVRIVSSIDLKSEEPGLLDFCMKYGLKSQFYSPEELAAVEGYFEESSFVKSTTGIGNVCERAALKASVNGTLILKKTAAAGVTVAIAADTYKIKF